VKRLRLLIIIALSALAQTSLAEHLYMARVKMPFPEAMLKLQETIKEHGYSISRVQRVDIGLTKSGYMTDKYRVVFYGKADENQKVLEQFPVLQAYFPLKIAIFAEDKDTLITSYDPLYLFGDSDPALREKSKQWETDLASIFKVMREAEE
jgi:uncharacterized protein (DUF302 family)